MADNDTKTAPAAPASQPAAPAAPAAPALPDSITLSVDMAWFRNNAFIERPAGSLITDPDEIAYLVSRGVS